MLHPAFGVCGLRNLRCPALGGGGMIVAVITTRISRQKELELRAGTNGASGRIVAVLLSRDGIKKQRTCGIWALRQALVSLIISGGLSCCPAACCPKVSETPPVLLPKGVRDHSGGEGVRDPSGGAAAQRCQRPLRCSGAAAQRCQRPLRCSC